MRNFLRCKFLITIASVALVSSLSAHAAEPPTEPMLRIDTGEHTAIINRIATDNAGDWLITASSDKTARVWNVLDGRLVATLRVPTGSGSEGELNAVAISPDGNTVALGGWTQFNNGLKQTIYDYNIYLFDRASGRLLRRLTGLPNAILHLAFSPDGRSLAVAYGDGLRIFSVADGQIVGEDRNGSASFSVHFSNDGRLVTTSVNGLLRLYRFNGGNLTLLVKRAAPGGKRPIAARFTSDGRHIAVGFDDTSAVNVLNANDLSFGFAPNTTGIKNHLTTVAWSRDGSTLYAAGSAHVDSGDKRQSYIRRWSQGGAGVALDLPVAGNTIEDLVTLPEGRLAFGSADPSWGIVDVNGERQIFHAPTTIDFRESRSSFALSPDGTRVRFGYELHGESPAVFESQNRSFIAIDTPSMIPPQISAPSLVVTDWKNSYAPKLNGTLLKIDSYTYEKSLSLAMLPGSDGFVLGTNQNLRLFDRRGRQRWEWQAPGEAWAVNTSQDGRWVVAAYDDGTIRWYRTSDGVEQLAFYPHPDKKRWIMWTPSGYYDASPGGEDLIGWQLNRGKDQAADFFPVSRFRDHFYRPDVLAKVFETRDQTEAVKLADQESGRRSITRSISQVLPPVVEIVSPQNGIGVSNTNLTIKAVIRTPADAPATNLRVRVNGLLQTTNSHNSQVKSEANTQEITVNLPQNDAEIQMIAQNKNGFSSPVTLRVTWAGKKAAPGSAEDNNFKPKLYVLAVGVSKYKNPYYNLGLAAKDATDFAAALMKQKGKLYGDVVVKLLTDDKATKDEVLDGLEWLKSSVTARDVGIMFVAGHGMNDKLGNYYFLPYNVNPEQLVRTGVSQNDIKLTFANLPGKTVFFVDTCYAGNVLGAVVTSGLINELASAENGAVVFAASTAGQLSQENASWGNGAFTKSVVEGLNGMADFRKNGMITANGLDYYVDDRVKSLTKGLQTPVSITPGGITDFTIAVVGK